MYTKDELDRIRKDADIVRIAGELTELRKSGALYKGRCPFHEEKTPSFFVYPKTATWKCYGCGAHGDVIELVARSTGMGFREVVESLAPGQCSAALSRPVPAKRPSAAAKTPCDFSRFLERASAMYAERLGEAMPHLVTRGISEEVARAHSVGFAPPEWRFLCDTFGEGSSEDLVASGLAVRTARGGTIDRYRNRIMFPVFRPDGRIAGFTGRTLEADSGVPKYLNSPEEAGFERNRVLLGVPCNTEAFRAAGFAYLVEGPFDFLAFVEAGIGNVLSPLSAHLSEEQAVILGNLCRGGAVLAFDGDKAGREGARSSLATLFGLGIPGMIAQFPDGEDPCSVLSASGPEGVVSVIGAAGIPERKKGVAGRVCEPAKTRKK